MVRHPTRLHLSVLRGQDRAYSSLVSQLPDGWSLERIREMGVREVRLLSNKCYVVEDRVDDLVELDPACIIDCGGLQLLLDRADGEWHMGSMDDDGAIWCWGSYGADLAEAIRAL